MFRGAAPQKAGHGGLILNRKERPFMSFTKWFFLSALFLTVGFCGCSQDQKSEVPKTEQITKNLVPPKVEIRGQIFGVEINDLKVSMNVNTSTKEITETPNLSGTIKITNKTKDVLDIQGVTLEYFNEAGHQIPFSSGEKIATVKSFWKALQPGEVAEGSLDVTIPKKAVIEKALGKIQVNLVYVPSPLKRETLILPEKLE
jgi:hypothetical protein